MGTHHLLAAIFACGGAVLPLGLFAALSSWRSVRTPFTVFDAISIGGVGGCTSGSLSAALILAAEGPAASSDACALGTWCLTGGFLLLSAVNLRAAGAAG